MTRAFSLCLSITLAAASPGMAQSTDVLMQAFGGEWFSFDPENSDGGTCKLTLKSDAMGTEGMRALETESCQAPLSTAARWRIAEGQIRLATEAGTDDVAILGGNQFRITGNVVTDGSGVVLERATGDPNSQAIRAALSQYRCYYKGFTSTCATEADLQLPVFEAEVPTQVRTLVNLNVRNQPRSDANVLGVVPRDATLTIDECLIASDGLWCKGSFSGSAGWFTRSALRDDTWPILTFVTN